MATTNIDLVKRIRAGVTPWGANCSEKKCLEAIVHFTKEKWLLEK